MLEMETMHKITIHDFWNADIFARFIKSTKDFKITQILRNHPLYMYMYNKQLGQSVHKTTPLTLTEKWIDTHEHELREEF